jgi:large subunit ribosomal protein L17
VDLIEKVFVDLARRYKDRPGGYTRIIKVGRRRGDNAPMALIELLSESEPVAKASKDEGEKAAEKAPEKAEAEGASAGGEEKAAAKKPARKTRAKKAKKEEAAAEGEAEAGKGEGA